MRHGMGSLLTALVARPRFVAYAVADLPALAPLIARHVFGLPLLTWAVRNAEERQTAARWADQMIFEGFRP
jgi:glycerophosphoryl diester phosphodiesterase